MSASQPALFNVQEFTDDGITLVGGRLYTYVFGTTAQKVAYTDPDGAVPQTYTADGLGGQYIALNARGELPTPLYLGPGAYDLSLKRPDGSTVWTRQAEGTANVTNALAAALLLPNGGAIVGITPGDANAVPTTVQRFVQKRMTRSVFDFMTAAQIDAVLAKTGVLDVGATVALAVNSLPIDSVLEFPDGVYNMGSTPLSIANLNTALLTGVGMPELRWTALPDGTDAVTIIGNSYRRGGISNLRLSMGFTGQDGIKIFSGDRIRLERVVISSALRDGLSLYCTGYNWIENFMAHDVVIQGSGRNGIVMEVAGSLGSFINESVFSEVEVRGVSLKSNGGVAVVAVCSGVNPAKISEIQWNACNFDAQRASAVANGFDIGPNPMVLAYSPSGNNLYESWTINGGAWETTTGLPDYRANGMIRLQSGSLAPGWNIKLGVSAGWSAGGISGNFQDYVLHTHRGFFRAAYPNGWRQTVASASQIFTFDVPLPVVPTLSGARRQQSAVYELTLFAMRYAGNDKKVYKQDIYLAYYAIGTDEYWSFLPPPTVQAIGADLFSLTSAVLINISGGSTLTSANPPWAVRCAISTAAIWGTSGGDDRLRAVVMHKGSAHEQYNF